MILSNNPLILADHINGDNFVQTVRQVMSLNTCGDYFKENNKVIFPDGIIAILINTTGVAEENKLLEAHRKFFDIHFTIEGNDAIAYKELSKCNNVFENYSEEGDYILYNEKPLNSLLVTNGYFCIIPNQFAHAALYQNTGKVTKIVFKVPVR